MINAAVQRFRLIFLFSLLPAVAAGAQPKPISDLPHLEKNGRATQLVVDGKPFLILGGNYTIPAHRASSICGPCGRG